MDYSSYQHLLFERPAPGVLLITMTAAAPVKA